MVIVKSVKVFGNSEKMLYLCSVKKKETATSQVPIDYDKETMVQVNLVNGNTNCTMEQFNKMLELCHQYDALVGGETMDIFATIVMYYKDYGAIVCGLIEYVEFNDNSIDFFTKNGGALLKEDHYETIFCNFDEVISEMERQLNEEQNN